MEHPLVIAGGPCAVNPEPMSRFIDLFVIGDGEEALPEVCDLWVELKQSGGDREALLAEMAARLPYVYVPRFYRVGGTRRRIADVGAADSRRCADADRAGGCGGSRCVSAAGAPIVPFVECVHERITIEIMRGCPGKCRFCQSTTIKRPLRFRKVETIVQAALDQYHNTGYNEISLLSLSTSDYPQFDELMRRLQETFRPLGVSVSLPSLRINEQLLMVGDLMNTDRHSGLTLAPEVALDDMRRQIGKPITNEDLYAGCRRAFENGFSRVKLYFMCGLPGEREADLAGIIEMSETIARLGQEVRGRPVTVVANVSNLVPKPQTPYPVERDAAARVFSECARVFASAKAVAERRFEVSRHRHEPVGRRDVSRRSASRRGDRVGMAARGAVRRLGGTVSAGAMVASVGRRGDRRGEDFARPLPCPGGVALGSDWDSARSWAFGTGALCGGGACCGTGRERRVTIACTAFLPSTLTERWSTAATN